MSVELVAFVREIDKTARELSDQALDVVGYGDVDEQFRSAAADLMQYYLRAAVRNFSGAMAECMGVVE